MTESEDTLTYPLSYQDVIEILRVVDAAPPGRELHLELGDFKLTVRKRAGRDAE